MEMFKLKESLFGLVAPLLLSSLLSVWFSPITAQGAQSDLQVTVADAGIDEYNLSDTGSVRTETFESHTLRNQAEFEFSGDAGSWSGTGYILASTAWGGANSSAGTTGRYAAVEGQSITLTVPGGVDHRYIGFWWSAGNHPNTVTLLSANDDVLATFQVNASVGGGQSLQDIVGTCPAPAQGTADDRLQADSYCGNPNYSPKAVLNEVFAFVHLRYEEADGDGFRKVRFTGDGFEFDNVTVSQTAPPSDATETNLAFNSFDLSMPPVALGDPRASSINFPNLALSQSGTQEPNAMICISQVADISGNPLTSSPTIGPTGSAANISTASNASITAFWGTRNDLLSFIPEITLALTAAPAPFGVGSTFFEVTVTPITDDGIGNCTGSNTSTAILELRLINILQANSMGIALD